MCDLGANYCICPLCLSPNYTTICDINRHLATGEVSSPWKREGPSVGIREEGGHIYIEVVGCFPLFPF